MSQKTARPVAKMTGLNLYLALSKLELLLEFGERASILPDCVLTAGVGSFARANVSDFRARSGEDLCSEYFTAKAVGEMAVKLAAEEGVITICERQGLVVDLQRVLSPALAGLLSSFNLCLGKVLAPTSAVKPDGLAARARGGQSDNLQHILAGPPAA